MSNWDTLIEYFADGMPASEYLWILVILAFSVYGFAVARKMVSKI
jgi:hypothetical protein